MREMTLEEMAMVTGGATYGGQEIINQSISEIVVTARPMTSSNWGSMADILGYGAAITGAPAGILIFGPELLALAGIAVVSAEAAALLVPGATATAVTSGVLGAGSLGASVMAHAGERNAGGPGSRK